MTTTKPMHPSGIVQIKDGVIYYEWPQGPRGLVNSLEIPFVDIKVIGEYTNQNGPFLDDYFICFVTNAPGWSEVSFYTEGRDNLLAGLDAYFGANFVLGLCGSTDFNSRILWPPRLEGRDFIEFEPLHSKSLWERIVGTILPSVSLQLSPEVLGYLKQRATPIAK